MPTTPEVWLSEFTVNAGNTSGTQVEPQITQLSNGNILVAWEDSLNNVDGANGTDIIGQIYDPLGNPVGAPFHMNTFRNIDDEGEFEIAATPGGGWILAYEDDNGAAAAAIVIDVFNSSGSRIHGQVFTETGSDTFNDPTVAVNGNGDAVIAWNVDDGAGSVLVSYTFYDQSAASFSGLTNGFLASSNETTTGSTQSLSVAALTDNSFVVVAQRAFGNDDIVGRKIDSVGGISGAFFAVSTGGTESTQPDVIGLEGGGFVAVWQQFDGTDRDAYFRIFNNAATPVGGEVAVNAGGSTNSNNELSVAALADGGFVVAYDNDEDNTIELERFNAGGTQVGSTVTVNSAGTESQPEVLGLEDGRFAIVYQEVVSGQDIRMQIFDTRDDANSPPVYTPDSWQIGTIGNDSFSADADSVYGYDGADTIIDGGGFNDVFGGEGNDSIGILGVSASESRDGGNGTDWLFGEGIMSNGTIYDLINEVVTLGATSESVTNFENVRGTGGNEILIGDDDNNELDGEGGNDTITGNGGSDTLRGGAGNDDLDGGVGH